MALVKIQYSLITEARRALEASMAAQSSENQGPVSPTDGKSKYGGGAAKKAGAVIPNQPNG